MKKSISLPLEGIKVVELGTHVAVPNATRFLADWGAQVIKVEGLRGEEWRTIGPSYKTPATDEENPIFSVQNANKKFIALDLKTPEGLEILKTLVKDADVFISNVRLKSLKKMGLDYAHMKQLNPQLIYFHFTGFGYEGPDAARPGFDMAAYWARSGVLMDWTDAGGYPFKPMGGFGDATVSSNICCGILAALLGRNTSGKGTFLTSSLYNSAIWYSASGIVSSQDCYGYAFPKSKDRPGNPFSHVYRCKDGEYIIITIINYNGTYEKMFRALGMEAYLHDDRFNSLDRVRQNIEAFMPIINAAFASKTRDELCALFEQADVVYEKLAHLRDVTKDEQAWANGYLKEITFSNGHKAVLPTVPIQFAEYPVEAYRLPGAVGRDTLEILKSIGYTEADYQVLTEKKAVK